MQTIHNVETGIRVVGDGHLGQILPPLWELLTNGLERHERSMLLPDVGGAGPGHEEEAGGFWPCCNAAVVVRRYNRAPRRGEFVTLSL